MRYQFYTADVFTDRPFGGNQLAVFPEAGELSTRQMQRVAQELNLSETVFVFPPSSPLNTRRLRIFTPGSELPFAGHPTIGSAYILAAIGAIRCDAATTPIVFEEGVGPVAVTLHAEQGRPTFAQLSAAKLPEVGPPPPAPRGARRAALAGCVRAAAGRGRAAGDLVRGAISVRAPARSGGAAARAPQPGAVAGALRRLLGAAYLHLHLRCGGASVAHSVAHVRARDGHQRGPGHRRRRRWRWPPIWLCAIRRSRAHCAGSSSRASRWAAPACWRSRPISRAARWWPRASAAPPC